MLSSAYDVAQQSYMADDKIGLKLPLYHLLDPPPSASPFASHQDLYLPFKAISTSIFIQMTLMMTFLIFTFHLNVKNVPISHIWIKNEIDMVFKRWVGILMEEQIKAR